MGSGAGRRLQLVEMVQTTKARLTLLASTQSHTEAVRLPALDSCWGGRRARGDSLTGLLYGVTPFDPVTFVVIPTTVGMVALVACTAPALRAARVDPLVALRYE
jgi:hypothetical protein